MESIFSDVKERMKKTIDKLQEEHDRLYTGRANSSILDKVSVDYYGVLSPINQVASISVTEARTIVIQPWDKSLLPKIEKAIQESDIGINPQNDGDVIRLTFPQLTEERRKEIVKNVKGIGEDSKVSVRAIRRDAIDKLKKMKKNSEITEDDSKSGEDTIQKFTDKFVKDIDDLCEAKTKEVLTV